MWDRHDARGRHVRMAGVWYGSAVPRDRMIPQIDGTHGGNASSVDIVGMYAGYRGSSSSCSAACTGISVVRWSVAGAPPVQWTHCPLCLCITTTHDPAPFRLGSRTDGINAHRRQWYTTPRAREWKSATCRSCGVLNNSQSEFRDGCVLWSATICDQFSTNEQNLDVFSLFLCRPAHAISTSNTSTTISLARRHSSKLWRNACNSTNAGGSTVSPAQHRFSHPTARIRDRTSVDILLDRKS